MNIRASGLVVRASLLALAAGSMVLVSSTLPVTTSMAADPAVTGSASTQASSGGGSIAVRSPNRPRATRCVKNRRGIPKTGALVGAAVGGTRDIGTLERQLNKRLPLRRTYFEADQVDSAIRSVRADLASGRLPWISFKLPHSWSAMAAGTGDKWATGLTKRLARVGGPVWLAFHHEPEGDGPVRDWVRMQRQLMPIVHAHSDNVATTVIYTGWDMLYDEPRYRLARLWPGSRFVDILGFDMYNNYGAVRDGRRGTTMLDADAKFFVPVRRFARSQGVRWAVAETAYTQAAAAAQPQWLAQTHRQLVARGGVGMAYFDSSRHSVADWTLADERRRGVFASVVEKSRRICR